MRCFLGAVEVMLAWYVVSGSGSSVLAEQTQYVHFDVSMGRLENERKKGEICVRRKGIEIKADSFQLLDRIVSVTSTVQYCG